ncbi:hypothetical protein ZWY2020_033081, partial [Hordeum vulgare]
SPQALLLVVSNPVDALAYLALKCLGSISRQAASSAPVPILTPPSFGSSSTIPPPLTRRACSHRGGGDALDQFQPPPRCPTPSPTTLLTYALEDGGSNPCCNNSTTITIEGRQLSMAIMYTTARSQPVVSLTRRQFDLCSHLSHLRPPQPPKSPMSNPP